LSQLCPATAAAATATAPEVQAAEDSAGEAGPSPEPIRSLQHLLPGQEVPTAGAGSAVLNWSQAEEAQERIRFVRHRHAQAFLLIPPIQFNRTLYEIARAETVSLSLSLSVANLN
ncbi:hypothetical protein BOX15_Mlig022829g2, partial [Macrostomum lignano]